MVAETGVFGMGGNGEDIVLDGTVAVLGLWNTVGREEEFVERSCKGGREGHGAA
jgi:hypothetical protein